MRALFLVIFAAIHGSLGEIEKTKIVQTKQGKVEGALSYTGLYYEFLGIKYGVFVNFRAPEEPPSFADVFIADNRAVLCPQFPVYDPLSAPSNNLDCLVLNIYSPDIITNSTNLPVMVFLHGGGFGVGSGSPAFYGPHYLVSHGVIVVTVNYRLNAYGFLNLNIEDAPGNAGLKDIRAALRWIRDNIENFNGDPDNVTIFGQGTGGSAALYLTLSDSTKGLFKRIISESGALFSPQTFDPNPLGTAMKLAKCLESNTEDPEELFTLFSEVSVIELEEALSVQMNALSMFVPSVETYLDDDPFLTDTPYNIIAKGVPNPVPVLIGLNTVEGLITMLDYFTITSQMDRIMHEDYSALDKRSMIVPDEDLEEFRTILKDAYFSNTTSEENLIGGLINLNTDFSYVGPMALFSEMYSNETSMPVYQYIFNHVGTRNLGRLLTNSSLPATCNLDELFYIFELETLPLPLDEDDARMITFMTLMLTNFAKYGSPTLEDDSGEWLPYPHTLAIALEPQYVTPMTPDRAYFWRSLYLKYGAEITD